MTQMISIEVSEKSVALPVDNKTLGEFISSLLGQPQTLEKRYEDAFSADHQWFIHFFSLILQRIQQQNAPEPLSFEANIQYRDKIERRVSSWHAFQHFSETQNIISTGVKFHIALLIQFPGKPSPERQELIFTFDTKENRQSIVDSLVGRQSNLGSINVEIRHTERTWADDILRLIDSELTSIQVVESKIKKSLRKAFFPIFSLSFPVMASGSMVFGEWSKGDHRDHFKKSALAAIENNKIDIQALHAKIDLLLQEATFNGEGRLREASFLLYSVLFAALIFSVGIFLAQPNPSFVVLSPAAQKYRTETLERQKKKSMWLFASMAGSIILGVVGNFIYDAIK